MAGECHFSTGWCVTECIIHDNGKNHTYFNRNISLESLCDKYQVAAVVPDMDVSCCLDLCYGDAYYTFLRLLGTPAVNADDEEKERREMYRVTLFHKGDFEAQLDKTKEVLKAAGVYINSIDAESYETETGYWLVPITVEILKEE